MIQVGDVLVVISRAIEHSNFSILMFKGKAIDPGRIRFGVSRSHLVLFLLVAVLVG